MIIILLVFLLLNTSVFAQQPPTTTTQVTNILTNITSIPAPPFVQSLPDYETVSSIITSSNSLKDIHDEFEKAEEYKGTNIQPIPDILQGVWWRFHTQKTTLYGIPAVSEEVLCLGYTSAIWVQDIRTTSTVHSKSQRRLQVAYFDLFDNMFVVFFYRGQDPYSQEVRDKQGFFVRVLPDGSYMQMSTSPNFEQEKSMFWRTFPGDYSDISLGQQ